MKMMLKTAAAAMGLATALWFATKGGLPFWVYGMVVTGTYLSAIVLSRPVKY